MDKLRTFILRRADAIEAKASTGWLLKWDLGEYWIKSSGYVTNFIWDSVAETLASCIAKDLNIDNYVHYMPCIIEIADMDGLRIIGCISRNYKTPGYREITIQKLMKNNILNKRTYIDCDGYNDLITEIKDKFNVNIRKYLEDTILIDSIILNTDRNMWNLSILTDNNLNGYVAPIYDFGNSLGLTGAFRGDFHEEVMYSCGIQARPFSYSFEEQLSYIRNNREYKGELTNTRDMLKFIYYNFTQEHNNYNIANPIPLDVLKYTTQVIDKRYKSVIMNKIWKN